MTTMLLGGQQVPAYQPLKAPRFHRETVPGGYEFVIPARKNWLFIGFISIWLTGWTVGGGVAGYTAVTQPEPFLYIWLVFWAFGWLIAVSQLAYMLTGCEFVRCAGGDLEIGFRSFLLNKTWRYRGSEIAHLAATDGPDMFARMFGGSYNSWPALAARRIGTLRFDHGARTIYACGALDRAEAQLIVTDLLRSIPSAG